MNFNEEQEKNMLSIYGTYENYYRSLRKPILNAFDVYKINVQYGIEQETDDQRTEMLNWYSRILKLDVDALINVPVNIKRYM